MNNQNNPNCIEILFCYFNIVLNNIYDALDFAAKIIMIIELFAPFFLEKVKDDIIEGTYYIFLMNKRN